MNLSSVPKKKESKLNFETGYFSKKKASSTVEKDIVGKQFLFWINEAEVCIQNIT